MWMARTSSSSSDGCETVDQLRELAAQLVEMHVDVVFANSSTEVEAARLATRTIPIVFANYADPVGVGHVSSLARPGGNITGFTVVLSEVVTKQLEIMKEVLPRMKRIGALAVVTAPSYHPSPHAVHAAGQRLGVAVVPAPVRTPEDLAGAFATMAREHVSGFVALQTPLLRWQRTVIAELALRRQYRLDSTRGHLHRQDSQGRQAGRLGGRAGFQVRARDQSQDRQSAWARDRTVAVGTSGSDHRLTAAYAPGHHPPQDPIPQD